MIKIKFVAKDFKHMTTKPSTKITVREYSDSLGDIIESFRCFLLACSFDSEHLKEYLGDPP